jgi:hypothetical protein
MFWLLTLPFRIAFLPITALWLAYKGLWWSIQGSAPGVAVPSALGPALGGAGVAGLVTGSSIWALRSAFAGTLAGSAIAAIASFAAAREGVISPDHAAWIWAWATLAITTMGLVLVRISQRPRAQLRAKMAHAAHRLKHGSRRAAKAAYEQGGGAIKGVAQGVACGWRQPEAEGAAAPMPEAVQTPERASKPEAAEQRCRVQQASPAFVQAAKIGSSIGRAGSKASRCIGHVLMGLGKRIAGERSAVQVDRPA